MCVCIDGLMYLPMLLCISVTTPLPIRYFLSSMSTERRYKSDRRKSKGRRSKVRESECKMKKVRGGGGGVRDISK